MSYHRILIGDVNVGRFWQASQAARPQLRDVPFKSASCFDTLEVALDSVSDEHDMALISMMTSVAVEEGSAIDVIGSAKNVFDQVFRRISAAAKKSGRCEVCFLDLLYIF